MNRSPRASLWVLTAPGRVAAALLAASCSGALAQSDDPGAGSAATGIWPLFVQSFDVFTVVLIVGSLIAVGAIVRTVLDVRASAILPRGSVRRIESMVRDRRFGELRELVARDRSMLARIVEAALDHPESTRAGMREAAEMAGSRWCAHWFRRIELLNVIGNLGPLVGLAGTVWGMILAFTSLGAGGGEADPGELSIGISKALFHTLLGLMLAIPCLAVFGVYRSIVDRICTRAMELGSWAVERLPSSDTGDPPGVVRPERESDARDGR